MYLTCKCEDKSSGICVNSYLGLIVREHREPAHADAGSHMRQSSVWCQKNRLQNCSQPLGDVLHMRLCCMCEEIIVLLAFNHIEPDNNTMAGFLFWAVVCASADISRAH